MGSRIHTVVYHTFPHPDEWLSEFLLQEYGEKVYPGVSTAKRLFWRSGSDELVRQHPDWTLENGYLLVGVGKSSLDEHPLIEKGSDKVCAANLVANALGLADNPAIQKLLKIVRANDREGKGNKLFGIGNIGMTINHRYGDGNDCGVMELGVLIMRCFYQVLDDRLPVLPKDSIDRLVAMWLMRRFGTERFADASETNFVGWRTDATTPQLEIEMGDRKVLVDPERFDVRVDSAKKSLTATLLKILAMSQEQEIDKVRWYVWESLRNGRRDWELLDLQEVLSAFAHTAPDTTTLCDWAAWVLDAHYDMQYEFFAAEPDFDASEHVPFPKDGKERRIVVGQSDNVLFTSFARHKGSSVVILRRSTGNTTINTHTEPDLKLDMREVVARVRAAEMRKRGIPVTASLEELACPGEFPGCAGIFFDPDTQSILNGSLSAPDIKPMLLSLRELTRIVLEVHSDKQ